jgi:hypothetical protein
VIQYQSPQLCQNGGIFNQGNRKGCRGPSEVNRVSGDDSHIVFVKKFLGEKGSVRWCIAMMEQPVLLSPRLG